MDIDYEEAPGSDEIYWEEIPLDPGDGEWDNYQDEPYDPPEHWEDK